MGKFKNWCNKPVTRGDYLKLCGYSLGAYALVCVGFVGYTMYQNHKYYKDLETQVENEHDEQIDE